MAYKYNPFTGELDRVGPGSGAPVVETITGNSGGAVGPDGAFNIDLVGAGSLTVTGNPGTNTLTIDDDGTLADTFTADAGSAVPVAGNLNLLGDATQGLSTSGAGDTITFTNSDASDSQKGVSELATDAESIAGSDSTRSIVPTSLKAKLGVQTSNSIPFGQSDSLALGWTSALTNGQVVIGSTAGTPSAANLTAGSGVVISNFPNAITIASTPTTPLSFSTDSGTATPAGFALNVLGGTGLATTGVGDTITVDLTADFEETAIHSWNGSILETAAVTVTSDGATITCSVELNGGGDLTVVFSDGFYDWDTTPADTVTLTAGTDTSPQLNFIYFLQSTKTLTASTVGFPATEHAPIATTICQSAASLQTDGPYKMHAWTDHVIATNDQGHISDLNFWIRQQNATWKSGVAQTYTITTNGGSPDNVILTTGAGVVLQLHVHTFPAFAGTPDVYVINDSVTPYTIVTDLNALLTDSTGASMSGRYFSLVIWGVVSEDTGDCKLFVNLPGGSYNNSASLANDNNHFANYSIPEDFKGTGFLISQWNLRHQAALGGTWTSEDEIDLRSLIPSISATGSTSTPNEFADNVFRIFDDGDDTKKLAFEVSAITTATTRTITMIDGDLDLATVSNSFPTDSGTAAPTANALTIAGGTNISTVGAGTTVTINSTGWAAFAWTEVTGTSQAAAVNSGYITNNAGLVTVTLPASAAIGDIIRVAGKGAGGWSIAQNAGQTVHFGNMDTTTGAGGSLDSTDTYDSIELLCITANTDFVALSSIGNITVT